MYELEILIFTLSLIFSGVYLCKWYYRIMKIFKPRKSLPHDLILAFIPLICGEIYYITLTRLASFDVVTDPFYIIFYILLGIVWMFCGEEILYNAFDISVRDDVLTNRNTSALYALTGGFIGLALIYAGANIGDGPGFWCVIIAGGIGLIIWLVLTYVLNYYTKIIDRILISRDLGSGIRFGGFLVASGVILARASGGDWFSFIQTIIDFSAGWLIIPLGMVYFFIELYYHSQLENENMPSNVSAAVFLALFMIIVSIVGVLYVIPPFAENPIYG